MNHQLPAAPHSGLDLPGAPALLQAQREQVVMATEADQDPLTDVDPVSGEPQGAGAVAQVCANGEVTLGELEGRGRRQNGTAKVSYDWLAGGLTSSTMYSLASRDVTESRVPDVSLVRRSS